MCHLCFLSDPLSVFMIHSNCFGCGRAWFLHFLLMNISSPLLSLPKIHKFLSYVCFVLFQIQHKLTVEIFKLQQDLPYFLTCFCHSQLYKVPSSLFLAGNKFKLPFPPELLPRFFFCTWERAWSIIWYITHEFPIRPVSVVWLKSHQFQLQNPTIQFRVFLRSGYCRLD